MSPEALAQGVRVCQATLQEPCNNFMRLKKAVITAAGKGQRTLPLQTLVDRDGVQKSALQVIIEEILSADINDICIVVRPGDQATYSGAAGDHARRLQFVEQSNPLGYGHAIQCAQPFTGDDAFLHLVGDHLYVSRDKNKTCAQQLVEVAAAEDCAVSAVQATREFLLPNYGVAGGKRLAGTTPLYTVDTVVEKPTPTQAEQSLIVSGLRAGYYLCFFGMHVLTAGLTNILAQQVSTAQNSPNTQSVQLSSALNELCKRERMLAYEVHGQRYDMGVKYGLLTAQLALALDGKDRAEVLAQLVELLATK